MMNFFLDNILAIGSISTAVAAFVALATLINTIRKHKADVQRAYCVTVRHNIIDFERQLSIWHEDFGDAHYHIGVTAALRDALQREEVPSPATPAFDDYIEKHGKSLCLDIWSRVTQSTGVRRSLASFAESANRLVGLLSIVGSGSRICHQMTRQVQSPAMLADIVQQLAVPERRRLVEKDRNGRTLLRHEEVQEFVEMVRAALAVQQSRGLKTIEPLIRFYDRFFREIKSLSDEDLYCLSHLSRSVRIAVAEGKTRTKEMSILLDATKEAVGIDTNGKLASLLADVENETKLLATGDG